MGRTSKWQFGFLLRRNETQFIRIKRGINLKSIRLSANKSDGDQEQITAPLA